MSKRAGTLLAKNKGLSVFPKFSRILRRALGVEPPFCAVCAEMPEGRRVRCNQCRKLVCKLCVEVTAKDHWGPLCRICARAK